MIILGLTGGIAMGKSTVAAMLRAQGLPVSDADAIVHQLLGEGGRAVAPVSQAFPGVEEEGAIDRQRLGGIVFSDPQKIKQLESILHPMVREEEEAFVKQHAEKNHPLIVLDIPLLYETGGEKRCDKVMLVTAPAWIQRRRALARPGMTAEKFERILKLQMPDAEKRKKADIIIPTGYGKTITFWAVKCALKKLQKNQQTIV